MQKIIDQGKAIMDLRIIPVIVAFLFMPFAVSAKDFIHDVVIEEGITDLSSGDTTTLSWKLSDPCTMTLLIVDIKGDIVRNLLHKEQQHTGEHVVEWDGRDDDGDMLPNGVYFAIMRGISQRKGIQVYNPTMEPWGVRVLTDPITWEQEKNEVRFAVDRPTFCRLRVYIENGGPMYMPLTGWRFFLPGEHTLPWDGRDLQGVIQVTDQPGYKIGFDGFSLPIGAITLSGSPTPDGATIKNRKSYPVLPPHGGDVALLIAQPDSISPDPLLKVDFQGDTDALGGRVAINVDFQPSMSPAQQLREDYELYLYVDGILDHEINRALLPQDIFWDTTRYPNGEHVITVNILSVADRAATYSQRVTVAN